MPKTPSTTLLRKVDHCVPGDYYHYDCPKCEQEIVALVINKGRIIVRATVCYHDMEMGETEREARLPKPVLAEIEALIAAKPEPEPEPVIEPVIPGVEGGPSFNMGPAEGVAPQEGVDAEA